MKLIKELIEEVDYEYLEESAGSGKKSLYVKGPFLVAEAKNRNGRVYKHDTLAREVRRYNEEYVQKNRAFGELGHPDTPSINLDRVSHMITSLQPEGNVWVGKAKILETPMGNIAKNIIEGGGQLGISSRGMGSLKNVNGVNIVQDDYHLATAGDLVADPSAPGAFVQGIMENKEWVFVNGIWEQYDIEQSQKQIRKASQREIEEVSLRIFENFINKLKK